MRVLCVIPGIGLGGGAERSLYDMAPGIRAAGIDLSILYFHDRASGAVDTLRGLGVPVKRVTARRWLGRVRSVRRELRRFAPDVLHTVLFEADIVGRFAALGTPVVVATSLVSTPYGPERRHDPSYSRWRVALVRWFESFTVRFLCHRVHANSWAVRDAAVEHLGLRPDQITVVHRGRPAEPAPVDRGEQRRRVREDLGIPLDAPLVLAVGRHEYQKNHRTLVRAVPAVAQRHPAVRVAIAGRVGAMTTLIEEVVQAERLEGRVLLLGHRRDVHELMLAADVLVQTSISEGLPGAIIEAMAVGVPVVATDVASVRELVDEKSAVIVPRRSSAAVAEAICDVLEAPEAAARRAQRAHERFEREFELSHAVDGMVAFYRSAAAA